VAASLWEMGESIVLVPSVKLRQMRTSMEYSRRERYTFGRCPDNGREFESGWCY